MGTRIKIEKIWLTGPELTEYLGFSNRTMQKDWRDSGELPYFKIGRVILYHKDDVDKYVMKHEQKQVIGN